ncbi:MAG: hypothetical protein CMA88_01390 [Euryarchaeota archaeon]|nr:hypothetical protein [Euryarchaeota archaeon]|tara:strand:- start:977 stop:1330 length:354 start_codon:yes stop_codon:yes gene_type:complete
MESPAVRMTRVLGGFCLTLLAASLIAILGEDGGWSDSYILVIALSLAAASFVLVIILLAGRGRQHGSWPSDKWVSRENEHEMKVRLESEMEEASMQRIGSNWAKMEMDHLESRHSEE